MKIKNILFIFGLLALTTLVTFAQIAPLSYQIKILKKEERELFGGLGKSNAPSGCSFNIFIMTDSSLSFPCGNMKDFAGDWIYIFYQENIYYVCPQRDYSKSKCLVCSECKFKVSEIKKLNVNH